MNPEKTTEVKLQLIRVIYDALLPAKHRLDSLLEDYYHQRIKISQGEYTALLEFASAAATLELMFQDYFEQAEGAKVDVLYLPTKEFNLVLELSKTVEICYRSSIAQSGMWTH